MPRNREKFLEYQREYSKKWYKKNKKLARIRRYETKRKVVEWFVEYKKNLKCSCCPESDPICIDFHHKDSSKKDANISRMANEGYGKKRILEEIAKCDVLCANCHRKVHAYESPASATSDV
jgi:hypothetical protein